MKKYIPYISYIVLIILFLGSLFFGKNFFQKKYNDTQKRIKKLENIQENLNFSNYNIQNTFAVESTKNSFLLSQLTNNDFHFGGETSYSEDKTTLKYTNQKVGFSFEAPANININTIFLDYRIGQKKPNSAISFILSNDLLTSLTGNIASGYEDKNMILYGTVFSNKEDFDKMVETLKTPMKTSSGDRIVSFGRETIGNVEFETIIQMPAKKSLGDIQIFYPNYSKINKEHEYYHIFYIGGNLKNFKSDIDFIKNSIKLDL